MKKLACYAVACFFTMLFLACNQASTTETSKDDGVNKNVEIAKSFYPSFEKGDWAAIDTIVDASFVDHGPMIPPGVTSNKDSLMKYMKMSKETFPDGKFEILHTAADGDMVFIHYHYTGTNTGAGMGLPGKGSKVDYMGVDLVKMKDGKAIEHWDYGDNITFMRQMDMMPGEPAAKDTTAKK